MQYKCRRCNSFGCWCIDNDEMDLLKRWDCEKNKISPFDIDYSSSKKYYFKCRKNKHDSELKYISNIIKQPNSRLCIGCHSFGQWGIDNIDPDFINKYWSDKNTINPFEITHRSTKKVWIKCQDINYHEDYIIACANFVKGEGCPYCKSKLDIEPSDILSLSAAAVSLGFMGSFICPSCNNKAYLVKILD